MSEEENVRLLREAFDDYSRGNLEGMLEKLAPDFELTTSGRFMDTEPVYHGRAGFTEFWNTFQAAWEVITVRLERIESVDGRVVVLGTFHGKGRESGVESEMPVAWLLSVANGLISQADTFGAWREALEAAGLEPEAPV